MRCEIKYLRQTLKRLARLPKSKLLSALEHREVAVLDEAQVNVADKTIVYVTNSGGKPSASQIGRLMATQSFRSGRNVLLFDLGLKSSKKDDENSIKDVSGISINASDKTFDQAQDFGGSAFFTSANFGNQMRALLKAYDQIFICSDDES